MPVIRTNYWMKPIPDRRFDYTAWYDGEEESGNTGFGRALMEAVTDLLDNCPPLCVDCNGKGGIATGIECATCEGSGERLKDDPLDPLRIMQ